MRPHILGPSCEKGNAGLVGDPAQHLVVGQHHYGVSCELSAAVISNQRIEAMPLLGHEDGEALALAAPGEP